MSVQSEIARLTSAKADIVSAITEKGVTVPSGAKLPDLGALIAAIEAGGGGGSGGSIGDISQWASGTFILTENATTPVKIGDTADILDRLGFPASKYSTVAGRCNYWLFAEPPSDISVYPNMRYAFVSVRPNTSVSASSSAAHIYTSSTGSSMSVAKWSSSNIFSFTETELKVAFGSSTIGYAGIKYTWVIARVTE